MRRILIVSTLLLATVAAAHADQTTSRRHHTMRTDGHKRADRSITVYNRDSSDPRVGWHDEGNGMRVCSYDCNNPEIPGSGFVCKDVQVMGIAMRECDK